MDFSKLLLGYQEIEDLIKLGIKEKYITSYTDYYAQDISWSGRPLHFKRLEQVDNSLFLNKNIANKSLLLKIIMLYDNIDSNRLMPFNITRLIDNGLFSDNTVLNKELLDDRSIEKEFIELKKNNFSIKSRNFLQTLFIENDKKYDIEIFPYLTLYDETQLCDTIDEGDIEAYVNLIDKLGIREEIIKGLYYLYISDPVLFFERYKSCEINERIINNIYKKYISPVRKLILEEEKRDNHMQLLNQLFSINDNPICSSCKYRHNRIACERQEIYCEFVMRRDITSQDLFSSMKYHIPVFSSYIRSPNISVIDSTKVIDDLYSLIKKSEIAKLMKVSFKQLNSLPEPKDLTEAIFYRNQPEIISFRNIFKNWCESLLKIDDETTLRLITKDFNKASEHLENKYRKNMEKQKFGNVFINIFLDIISGIPAISHLTLPYTIKRRFAEREEAIEDQKHEWFLLTK
jgi:hypothetical protein